MFTRSIVCLPGCNSEFVPTNDERAILKSNGIGEAAIDFKADGDAQYVQDQILRYVLTLGKLSVKHLLCLRQKIENK